MPQGLRSGVRQSEKRSRTSSYKPGLQHATVIMVGLGPLVQEHCPVGLLTPHLELRSIGTSMLFRVALSGIMSFICMDIFSCSTTSTTVHQAFRTASKKGQLYAAFIGRVSAPLKKLRSRVLSSQSSDGRHLFKEQTSRNFPPRTDGQEAVTNPNPRYHEKTPILRKAAGKKSPETESTALGLSVLDEGHLTPS